MVCQGQWLRLVPRAAAPQARDRLVAGARRNSAPHLAVVGAGVVAAAAWMSRRGKRPLGGHRQAWAMTTGGAVAAGATTRVAAVVAGRGPGVTGAGVRALVAAVVVAALVVVVVAVAVPTGTETPLG